MDRNAIRDKAQLIGFLLHLHGLTVIKERNTMSNLGITPAAALAIALDNAALRITPSTSGSYPVCFATLEGKALEGMPEELRKEAERLAPSGCTFSGMTHLKQGRSYQYQGPAGETVTITVEYSE